MTLIDQTTGVKTPKVPGAENFTQAGAAVDRLIELYDTASKFLCAEFAGVMQGTVPLQRIRAFYPEIRITTTSFAKIDSRLSFGHVPEPGSALVWLALGSVLAACRRGRFR